MLALRRLRAVRATADGGFSLAESMVALTIASFVLTALGAGTLTAVKATTASRATQQSGDLLSQTIEQVRSLDYSAVANRPSQVAGDPALGGTVAAPTYTPPGGTAEPVVLDTVGSVAPFADDQYRNNVKFTVKRYVTRPTDVTGAAYKRVTVVITWSMAGQPKSKSASTLLSETERGLPLPRFRIQGSPSTRTVTPGNEADFGLRIDNLGARDAFELSVDAGTWTYYVDTDQDGSHDAGETTPAPDADGDGIPDTGYLEPNGVAYLVATRITTVSETGTVNYVWSGTSIAQPAASTASASTGTLKLVLSRSVGAPSPSPTVATGAVNSPATVTPAACSGNKCAVYTYYLKQAVAGNTASESTSTMREGDHSPQASLGNYSTEAGSGTQGRYLALSGTAAQLAADYRYAIPYDAGSKNKAPAPTVEYMAGQAVVRVHVQCATAGATVGLTASIGHASSAAGSATSVGSGTTTVTNCPATGFHTVDIGLSVSAVPSTATHVSVRVALATGSGSAVRLAYDTASYASYASIPRSN